MKAQTKIELKTFSMIAALFVSAVSVAKPTVDLVKSEVKWEGEKVVGGGHQGLLKLKGAQVAFDKAGALNGAQVTVNLSDIEVTDLTGDKAKGLKDHLLSADFFDAAKFPEAKFVAKTFTKVSHDKAAHGDKLSVAGDLTIKGATHPETMTVLVKNDGKTSVFEGDLKFDRTKYGVMYSSGKVVGTLKDKIIKDEVEIAVKLVVNN